MMIQMAIMLLTALALVPPAHALPELLPDCAAHPYGTDGKLSEQDLKDLFYVGFPQTAPDMRGRFGSPLCFNEVADYYLIEGTADHYIAVDYDGANAIGWRAWGIEP